MAETKQMAMEVILRGLDQLSAPFGSATRSVDKLAAATARLHKISAQAQQLGRGMMMAGGAMAAGIGVSLGAFAELQRAQAEMANAFTTIKGPAAEFEELNKQAIQFGNLYPGTTKDFIDLVTSMKMAGAEAKDLKDGAFGAASALAALFGDSQGFKGEQAGFMFQKMANGMGIAGKDANYFADQLQRISYSSGLKLPGIFDSLKYSSSAMKSLGVQGKGQSELVLAMMGTLSKGGLEDSQIGTSMRQFFDRLAIAQARIAGGDTRGAAMKAAFKGLGEAGVNLEFFGKGGKFLGMANAIEQLEQVRGLKSDFTKSLAGKALFGEGGQRVVALGSVAAINQMIAKQREQEAIETRLQRVTSTLSARYEALTGSIKNLLAEAATPLGEALAPLLERMNLFIGKVQDWTHANPKLVGQLSQLALGLTAFLVGGGASIYTVGKLITVFTTLKGVLTGFTLSSPWFLGLAALAGVGYLIYKNWDAVSPVISSTATNMGKLADSLGRTYDNLFKFKGGETKGLADDFTKIEKVAITFSAMLDGILNTLSLIGTAFEVQSEIWQPILAANRAFETARAGGAGQFAATKAALLAGGKASQRSGQKTGEIVDSLAGHDPFSIANWIHGEANTSARNDRIYEGRNFVGPREAHQITHSPTIVVQGPADKAAILEALRQSQDELVQIIQSRQATTQRGNFNTPATARTY